MESILSVYANLLVNYCLEIQPGEKLFINSTTLAEPLVREVYRSAISAGGIVETMLGFREQNRILLKNAEGLQLEYVPLQYRTAMEEFDAYLFIMAPFTLRDDNDLDGKKLQIRQNAFKPFQKLYSERTATRSLKRNLCQFPTLANAQEAGLSLEEYENFVFKACKLFDPDPIQSWLDVRKHQQKIVDFLNKKSSFRYLNQKTDISFSTKGRTWINSDGQTNMPSGEVYTSPVEDSVNGTIHFSFPTIFSGKPLEDIALTVKDGRIEQWNASKGKEILDAVFEIEGTRYFGEVAIGTNYNIDRLTNNILFDEKIGGTVHMAIGQSYFQAGGKNNSPIHWDLITEMRNGGAIWADDELIYQNGQFLF